LKLTKNGFGVLYDIKKNPAQKIVIYRGFWNNDKFHGKGVLFNLEGIVNRAA